MARGIKPTLVTTVEVEIEELDIVTGVLLELLQGKNELEDVKEIATRLHGESSKRLNMVQEIAGGQRSIKQYKKFLILDYIQKKGGIEKVTNRKELVDYAGTGSYDILYHYLGEMIQEGLIELDMRAWSKNAGSYMKD